MDSWLPDLEVGEFATVIRMLYPSMELLRVDGGVDGGARSPRRNELLHALREAQSSPLNDTASWAAAPESVPAVEGVSRVGLRAPEMVFSVARQIVDQGESRSQRRGGSIGFGSAGFVGVDGKERADESRAAKGEHAAGDGGRERTDARVDVVDPVGGSALGDGVD